MTLKGYSKAWLVLFSKHLWKTRSGICIYKTSLLHRPVGYIGFTSSCPPHFTTKLRPWLLLSMALWATRSGQRDPIFKSALGLLNDDEARSSRKVSVRCFLSGLWSRKANVTFCRNGHGRRASCFTFHHSEDQRHVCPCHPRLNRFERTSCSHNDWCTKAGSKYQLVTGLC